MADYDWFDNLPPTEAEKTGAKWRAQGLHPVFATHYGAGGPNRIKHYQCRRGCGCLVWNPEDHIKNVCTEFSPIVNN